MKYEKFINLFYDRFILFHFIATVLWYWTFWTIEMCSKFLFDIKQVYLLPLITILIFQNCLYMYLKNEDFVFRHNYGFWVFPIEPIYFPLQYVLFFLNPWFPHLHRNLQENLCDTGVDNCVQMIRDRLMSCSILFYTFKIWNIP